VRRVPGPRWNGDHPQATQWGNNYIVEQLRHHLQLLLQQLLFQPLPAQVSFNPGFIGHDQERKPSVHTSQDSLRNLRSKPAGWSVKSVSIWVHLCVVSVRVAAVQHCLTPSPQPPKKISCNLWRPFPLYVIEAGSLPAKPAQRRTDCADEDSKRPTTIMARTAAGEAECAASGGWDCVAAKGAREGLAYGSGGVVAGFVPNQRAARGRRVRRASRFPRREDRGNRPAGALSNPLNERASVLESPEPQRVPEMFGLARTLALPGPG